MEPLAWQPCTLVLEPTLCSSNVDWNNTVLLGRSRLGYDFSTVSVVLPFPGCNLAEHTSCARLRSWCQSPSRWCSYYVVGCRKTTCLGNAFYACIGFLGCSPSAPSPPCFHAKHLLPSCAHQRPVAHSRTMTTYFRDLRPFVGCYHSVGLALFGTPPLGCARRSFCVDSLGQCRVSVNYTRL